MMVWPGEGRSGHLQVVVVVVMWFVSEEATAAVQTSKNEFWRIVVSPAAGAVCTGHFDALQCIKCKILGAHIAIIEAIH